MYDRQKNQRGGKQAQKVSHVTIRLLTAPTKYVKLHDSLPGLQGFMAKNWRC